MRVNLMNIILILMATTFVAGASYTKELMDIFPYNSAPDNLLYQERGQNASRISMVVRAYQGAKKSFLTAYFLRPDHTDFYSQLIHIYLEPAAVSFGSGDYEGARRNWAMSSDRTEKYLQSYSRIAGMRDASWRRFKILLPLRDEYSISVFDEARGFLDDGDGLYFSGQFANARNQLQKGRILVDDWFKRIAANENRARLMAGYAGRRLSEVEQFGRATEFYPQHMDNNRKNLRNIDNYLLSGQWRKAMQGAVSLLEDIELAREKSEELKTLDMLAERVEILINQCRNDNGYALFAGEFDGILRDYSDKFREYLREQKRVLNRINENIQKVQYFKGYFLYTIANLERIGDYSKKRSSQEINAFSEPVTAALKSDLFAAFFPMEAKAGRMRLSELEAKRLANQTDFDTAARDYQILYGEIMPLDKRLKKVQEARDKAEDFAQGANANLLSKRSGADWANFVQKRNMGKSAWDRYLFLEAEKGYLEAEPYIIRLKEFDVPVKSEKVVQEGLYSYKVKPGDSLWNLSRKLYGESVLYHEILSYNPKLMERGEPWALSVGEILYFPRTIKIGQKSYALNEEKAK